MKKSSIVARTNKDITPFKTESKFISNILQVIKGSSLLRSKQSSLFIL